MITLRRGTKCWSERRARYLHGSWFARTTSNLAHVNVIRDLLARLACPQTDKHLAVPDIDVVFPYEEARAQAGLLAP